MLAIRIANAEPAGPPPITQTSVFTKVPSTNPGWLGPVCQAEVVRTGNQQSIVGSQAIVKPTANVVAGGPSPLDHFVVATAAAHVPCPASGAWFLAMHVPIGKPSGLPGQIYTSGHVAHGSLLVADKTVACG